MSQTFIFTALECEAKPLINYFGLKKEINNHAYSIYKNENTILTVSGVGKVAMAGAVSYSLAIYQVDSLPILLNIGIAGHKTLQIGTLSLANKVVDIDSTKKFFPQLIGNGWPETCEINTFSRPSLDYTANCLCDMEASAFYETALRFSTSELIHCIKVISDNQNSSVEKIQAKLVVEWIEKQISEIDRLLKYLNKLRNSISSKELRQCIEIEKKWHFTVSGKIRLRALLVRWELLSNDIWLCNEMENYKNSKEVLQKLEADVARLKMIL